VHDFLDGTMSAMASNPNATSTNRYLDGRVTTASQPQLQLMLLEGACRFGRQSQQLWDDPAQSAECERLLARTMAIGEELVRSVTGRGLDAAARLEEEYAFAFRQLAVAHVSRDAAALEAALRIYEFHRETWRLACEGLSETSVDQGAATPTAVSPLSKPSPFIGGFGGVPSTASATSFSLEA
jgi:flagellar biosynthetic protein FliS